MRRVGSGSTVQREAARRTLRALQDSIALIRNSRLRAVWVSTARRARRFTPSARREISAKRQVRSSGALPAPIASEVSLRRPRAMWGTTARRIAPRTTGPARRGTTALTPPSASSVPSEVIVYGLPLSLWHALSQISAASALWWTKRVQLGNTAMSFRIKIVPRASTAQQMSSSRRRAR